MAFSFTPIESLRPFVETNVSFKVRRKDQAEPFIIVMKPVLVNPKQEMLDAQKASIRIIEQAGKQIGYVHIYSYAGDEYHRELHHALVWGALKNADALIIDLRYGLGEHGRIISTFLIGIFRSLRWLTKMVREPLSILSGENRPFI